MDTETESIGNNNWIYVFVRCKYKLRIWKSNNFTISENNLIYISAKDNPFVDENLKFESSVREVVPQKIL